MADYRLFFVERRTADGWVVPPTLVFWGSSCYAELGEFLWAHPRQHWLDLFASGWYGIDSLFALRPDPPDDRRGSALLRYLETVHRYDYAKNEYHLAWLPYEELFVDCWDTDTLILGYQVPARYALLFGNGEQAFPAAELAEAGVDEKQLERFRNGWWTDKPADMTFGPDRYQLSQLPPDRDVWVTWRETIAGFLGVYADPFRGLRRYGSDDDLRILTMWA